MRKTCKLDSLLRTLGTRIILSMMRCAKSNRPLRGVLHDCRLSLLPALSPSGYSKRLEVAGF